MLSLLWVPFAPSLTTSNVNMSAYRMYALFSVLRTNPSKLIRAALYDSAEMIWEYYYETDQTRLF